MLGRSRLEGGDFVAALIQGFKGCMVDEMYSGAQANRNDSYTYPPVNSIFGGQNLTTVPIWVNYSGSKLYLPGWSFDMHIGNVTGQPTGYTIGDITSVSGWGYYNSALPMGGRWDLIVWNPTQQSGTYPVSNYKMYLTGLTGTGTLVPNDTQQSIIDICNYPGQVVWAQRFLLFPQTSETYRLNRDIGCRALQMDPKNVLYITLKASTNFTQLDATSYSWTTGTIIMLVYLYMFSFQTQVQEIETARITPGGNMQSRAQDVFTSLGLESDRNNPPT